MGTTSRKVFAVSREEVEVCDIQRLLLGIARHVSECGGADRAEGTVGFQLTGWDQDPRELWEIPAVKNYFDAIHGKFPVFPYFLMSAEFPAAGLYFRIVAQPDESDEGMVRVAHYLNEAMLAICSYSKAVAQATKRNVDPVVACHRLSEAVGFEVDVKELRSEFKNRGWI